MKGYKDIAGDGGSKIIEQVLDQKARIEENLASVQHLVAIASGNGGVGKSTLTMQLAFEFNKKGLKVSVLDADFNGPSLAKLSGVEKPLFLPGTKGLSLPKTKEGIGVLSFGTIFPEPESVSFGSVSKGESYVWQATKEFSILGTILAQTEWGKLDILLMDLPPGVERTCQFSEFFGQRTKFVLITIPSDISRGVVARSLSALKKIKSNLLGTIENMSGYFCPECKKVKPLFPNKKNVDFGIPSLGAVPFDPELAEMCDRGSALTSAPHLPSAKAVEKISENILKMLQN